MTKARPLPYSAGQAIDEALMGLANALRELLPLVKGSPATAEEQARRLAMAIHHIHESVGTLKTIRRA